MVMNEIKSNEWFNWKLSYSNYLNVMNVYIKFYVYVHKYTFYL